MPSPSDDAALKRLRDLGIDLPAPETTVYDYIPLSIHNRVAYLAGQIPKRPDGLVAVGRAGDEVSLELAQEAARVCVEQALSWIHAKAGGIDNVERVLRMDCYVAAAEGFEQISNIADAASGLLIALYGEAGRHPRSVIGVSRLPRQSPVLLELTFALKREPE
jgi:enamine deaminase RidA (YjgF/YER057c/UK114 family)